MQTGSPRVAALAAALVLSLPAFAAAQTTVSYAYKVPPGWTRSAPVAGRSTYVVRDGDKVHLLSIGATTKSSDVEAYTAEQIAIEKARGAEIIDEGATTLCDGEPAHRWTMHSASTGVATETHFMSVTVTGGIATMIYTHRQDVGDRRDGLEAMTTLCPGPFSNPVPAGWTPPKSRLPGGLATSLDSPDATSTFIASYRPLGATTTLDTFEKQNPPSGIVLADRREPCGTGTVHRIDVQVANQIAEISVALVHGFAYRYVYTRPSAHEPDAGAERALTAFCRSSVPLTGASPAPV